MNYKKLWSKNKSPRLAFRGLRQMKRRPLLGLALLGAAVYLFFTGEESSPDYPATALQEVFTGQVVLISDGDTITVALDPETTRNQKVKIRLFGIDAPEKKQDHYLEAKNKLQTMLRNQTVKVETYDTDQYGRVVGRVFLGDKAVDLSLISEGLAWVYPRYCQKSFCKELEQEEEKARDQKIGLWQNPDPTPPWEWRRQKHKQ